MSYKNHPFLFKAVLMVLFIGIAFIVGNTIHTYLETIPDFPNSSLFSWIPLTIIFAGWGILWGCDILEDWIEKKEAQKNG